MSEDKPEVPKWMRVAGVVGGIIVGALVGAIAMAVATMLDDVLHLAGVPSPLTGALGGGAIGLVLGLCFPEKLARALGELIAIL